MPQTLVSLLSPRADAPAQFVRAEVRRGTGAPAAVAIAARLVAMVALLAAAHGAGDTGLRLIAACSAAVVVATSAAVGAAAGGGLAAAGRGLLAAMPFTILATTFGDGADLRLAAALVAFALLPGAAGLLPAIGLRHLDEARRDDVVPSLLLSATAGGTAVVVAIAAAHRLGISDDRFDSLVPYVAAGLAVLALAEVLAHHRIGAGFATTVAAVTGAAIAVEVVLLIDTTSGDIEGAVIATVIGTGAAALGLLVATALATPRPFVVPVEEAADGPRLGAVVVGALAAVAALARVVSAPALWIDEADTSRVTDSSFRAMTDAAREGHAHPPLHDGLVWLSRQAFGSSEWALRLPSIVAGVALVPAVYVVSVRLFDRRVGLISAAIVAVGPGFVWLSHQAQPGALTALLVTLSLLALLVAVEKDRLTDWLLFAVACGLLSWSHQLAIVPVVVLHTAAAVTMRQRRTQVAPLHVSRWAMAAAIDAAAFVALLLYRDGLGPPDVLPPFEYATDGAPAAGRSVFGLTGIALTGILGFHPPDVTSRLLALWPLCMLGGFVLLGRPWSRRGAIVVALAVTPFIALLLLQVFGAPRNPPFALGWTATAMPLIAIGAGCAIGRAGRWRTSRALGVVVVVALGVALVDQTTRVDPLPRYDVASAVDDVSARAGEGDVVVYAPEDIGDLVRQEVEGATVVAADDVGAELDQGGDVYVVGAFAWRPGDPAVDRALELVHELSSERTLAFESGTDEAKVWQFS